MSIFGRKGKEADTKSETAPDIAINVRMTEDGARVSAIYTSKGTEYLKDGGNRAYVMKEVGRLLKNAAEQSYGKGGRR